MSDLTERIEALRLNPDDVVLVYVDDPADDYNTGDMLAEAMGDMGLRHLIVQLPVGATITALPPEDMDAICEAWLEMRTEQP